jgi:hypothetical protein
MSAVARPTPIRDAFRSSFKGLIASREGFPENAAERSVPTRAGASGP